MSTTQRTVTFLFITMMIPHAVFGNSPGIVPGTGTLISYVGDDFEDPSWGFMHNHPKSSRENDERTRFPRGVSTNGRWFEGPERGHPDSLKVIPTPPGGLAGSQSAALVRTLNSGVPGRKSFDVQQDDLIVDCVGRIGAIPISEMPNVVVRVYLPPADTWENRTGPHFGFRTAVVTTALKSEPRNIGRFRSRTETVRKLETYWPGIWIHFRSETDQRVERDSAFLTVRGNRLGRDFKVRDILASEFGWWTFGMSYTSDGMVHYFAHAGVDDLTADDYVTSQFPYSYQAERFETMFFDYCNKNDGHSWSTPFVIDDPQLFVVKADRVQLIVQRKQQARARQARQGGSSRK